MKRILELFWIWLAVFSLAVFFGVALQLIRGR
jgi:hypothetical protein